MKKSIIFVLSVACCVMLGASVVYSRSQDQVTHQAVNTREVLLEAEKNRREEIDSILLNDRIRVSLGEPLSVKASRILDKETSDLYSYPKTIPSKWVTKTIKETGIVDGKEVAIFESEGVVTAIVVFPGPREKYFVPHPITPGMTRSDLEKAIYDLSEGTNSTYHRSYGINGLLKEYEKSVFYSFFDGASRCEEISDYMATFVLLSHGETSLTQTSSLLHYPSYCVDS